MPAKQIAAAPAGPRAAALTSVQRTALLATLKGRFATQMHLHEGIEWKAVEARLDAHPAACNTLPLQLEQLRVPRFSQRPWHDAA